MKHLLCLSLVAVLASISSAGKLTEDSYPDNEIPDLLSPLDNWEDASDEEIDDQVAAPCCFPQRWQGSISSGAGFTGRRGPKFVRSQTTVAVDSTTRRIAGTKNIGKANESFIVLFNANNTADLYVFNAAEKKCLYKKLNQATFRPQCIPPNATLLSSFALGPRAGGLAVDSWLFEGHSPARSRGPKIFLTGKILVARGCIPVLVEDRGMVVPAPRPHKEEDTVLRFNSESESESESEEANNSDEEFTRPKPRPRPKPRGVAFVATAYFSNVQTTIPDPSVFTPPAYCKKSDDVIQDVAFGSDQIPSVLERFISY